MNEPTEAKYQAGPRAEFHIECLHRFHNSQPPAWRKLLSLGDRVPPRSTPHRIPVEGYPGDKHQGGQVPPDVGEADSAREATAHCLIARQGAATHLSCVGSSIR